MDLHGGLLLVQPGIMGKEQSLDPLTESSGKWNCMLPWDVPLPTPALHHQVPVEIVCFPFSMLALNITPAQASTGTAHGVPLR